MDVVTRLEQLLRAAEAAGIEVRAEPLDGQGGGLCTLKGHRVLFVDTSADVATRYDNTVRALVEVSELDNQFLPPVVRGDLEHRRRGVC
jgi:hypothetical protein